MKKTLIIVFGSLALLTGVAYAATVPSEPAVYDSVLSAPLGSSDTTIYLKSNLTTQGTALSGYNCFTIDVNTPNLEYACGTVSGTNVTGLTRNIDYFTGTTTNSNTSVPSHRTGADIRITDFPFAQIVHNILAGLDTLPVNLHYTSGITQSSVDSYALADVAYVNATAIAGAPNSSETVNGISQIATGIQAASTTSTGSTGARLVLPASLATSSDDVSGLHVVVTQNSGKINWNQIDLGNPFTVTGLLTLATGGFIDNASSTFTSMVNINGTLNVNGSVYSPKFGGNGANGALNISSGTTTVNLNGLSYYELDYTSISITGTGELTFSNPNARGTFIILRSEGATTITSTEQPAIDVSGLGGAGAASCGGSGCNGTSGSNGNSYYLFLTNGGGGAIEASSVGAGGAVPTLSIAAFASTTIAKYGGNLWVGAGGGGAASGNSGGSVGGGGNGGGGLLIESAGTLNFTGNIWARGVNGGTSVTHGGGGGGGAGGLVKILYNSLTSNSGTISVTAGTGASGIDGTLSGGGGGASGVAVGVSGSTINGGNGGVGTSSVEMNTNF